MDNGCIIKIQRTLLIACFGMLAVFTVSAGHAVAQETLSNRALVEALRRGGYVVYFRHAATDWSRDDHVANAGDWDSCDPNRMRQLSEQGRATARRIGAAIRGLGIPVGRVISSEYCRTRQTAELMDIGPVEPTRAVMNMRVAHLVGGSERVIERAQRELARAPQPGTNTVIVAHGNLMQAASGAYTGEAGAGVFAPLGNRQFRLVALLEPERWQQLADRFARP